MYVLQNLVQHTHNLDQYNGTFSSTFIIFYVGKHINIAEDDYYNALANVRVCYACFGVIFSYYLTIVLIKKLQQ